MPSYLVTGASRGLGYEFVRQLSQNQSNTVIGLVRNKAATDQRLAQDNIKNVILLEADITDFASLQKAAAETSKITGGSLDHLINNAALVYPKSETMALNDFENDIQFLEKELIESFTVNVVGVAKTISAFLPLIKKSEIKKVITLSTGMADLDAINQLSVPIGPVYATNKAALNVLVAKYSAAYSAQSILFMSISPGFVATEGNLKSRTPEELAALGPLMEAFQKYAPHFTGPISPQESVEKVLKIVEQAVVEKDGGSFVSQNWNKMWL